MAALKSVGTIFSSVQSTVKTSSGSAINIVICLVTVGSEQLFSFAAFNCPCPANGTSTGGVQQNYLYGWVFILVPAMALFVLGYAMNMKTWKLMTGCCQRSARAARGYVAGCSTLLEICVQALVAPFAWMSVAFLDGKYYACAATVAPYVNSCINVITKKLVTNTEEFDVNKRKSQIIGWCLVAVALFFGSIFYMVHRCMSPLTYHHRKYARWYREAESKAFELKAKKQIDAEVGKETVERFLMKKRDKYQWDKISTVFNFTRDKYNYALYSRLDEWNEEHKKTDPLPGEVEVAREVTEDDFSLETKANTSANNNGVTIPEKPQVTPREGENGIEMIPKIPPPPMNINARKRRSSSSGFEDDPTVTSHLTTTMTSKQPSNVVAGNDVTTQQSPIFDGEMTSLEMISYENDATEQSDLLLRQKSMSMPHIPGVKIKSNTNGGIHMRTGKSEKAPFFDDDDDATVT